MGENNCRLSVWEVYFCFPLPHTRPYAHRERLNKTLGSPPVLLREACRVLHLQLPFLKHHMFWMVSLKYPDEWCFKARALRVALLCSLEAN